MAREDGPRDLRGIDGGRRGVSLNRGSLEPHKTAGYFLVPHEDSKGHSYRIDTRIPPNMDYLLNMAVQSRQFPWKTRAEAYRWCIWRGVVELQGIVEAGSDTMYSQLAVLVDLYREERAVLDFRETMAAMAGVINDLLARGARTRAKALIRETIEKIEGFTDEYWREQYKEEVQHRFAYLMKGE